MAAFLADKAESTRYLYALYLRKFLALSTGRDPALTWDDATLVWAYEQRLAGAGDRPGLIRADLETWARGMVEAGLKYRTVRWRTTVAREFAEWLADEGLTPWQARKVADAFKNLKEPPKPRAGLTPERLGAILNWMAPVPRAFAQVCKASGCRPVEAARLQAMDVQTRYSPWRVTFREVKEGGDRTSFLDHEARAHVARLLDARALNGTADPRLFWALGRDDRAVKEKVLRDWEGALRQLGLAQRNPDGRLVYTLYLVRSFFRQAGRRGMDREVLEVLMGHHGEATENAYRSAGSAGEAPILDYDWLAERYMEGMGALAVEGAPA
jgi:integrase